MSAVNEENEREGGNSVVVIQGSASYGLPEGWSLVDNDMLPPDVGAVSGAIAVFPEVADDFAANLVLISGEGLPEDLEQWLVEGTRALYESIPGFFMTDLQWWSTDSYDGLVRCGTYLQGQNHLTVVQWTCVGAHSVCSLTATCSTRQFEQLWPVFVDAADSLREG